MKFEIIGGFDMDKSKVNQLYESAWQFTKAQKRALDFDDSVYINLLSELYEKLKENPLFCDDIMTSCTDRFLIEDSEKDEIEKNRGEALIEVIAETLELNKRVHYLLIPINGARLSNDIHFGSFHFIEGTEKEKEEKIQQITGIDSQKINFHINHTKKSRSKDFMMPPILVLQIDNVNTNVHRSASITAQRIFQILKLMIYKSETEKDLFESACKGYEDNYHVAIVGEEEWQFGHGVWWNLIQCKYSLDFLSKLEDQTEFVDLANTFVFEYNSTRDNLYHKFSNALELFERSLEQYENFRDVTLSMLLVFSAAESLLTENRNEKKRRLATIWSRLVTITGKTQEDLYDLIIKSYKDRCDFVHDGNLMYDIPTVEIRVLHQMLAKLIYKYLSPTEWENTACQPIENNITKWREFINKTFTDAQSN